MTPYRMVKRMKGHYKLLIRATDKMEETLADYTSGCIRGDSDINNMPDIRYIFERIMITAAKLDDLYNSRSKKLLKDKVKKMLGCS